MMFTHKVIGNFIVFLSFTVRSLRSSVAADVQEVADANSTSLYCVNSAFRHSVRKSAYERLTVVYNKPILSLCHIIMP